MKVKRRIKPVIDEEKVKKVKSFLESGVSIHEAGRMSGVSYYTAWKVSKGWFENRRFREAQNETNDEKLFSWKNFKLY